MNEKPTQASVDTWASLFQAYRLLRDQTEEALKQAGLPPLAWYDVLWAVHRAPEDTMRQKELGDRVLLNKHNLSRLLDRLVAKGLVTKQASRSDKRCFRVELTPEGRTMCKQMWAVYSSVILDSFAVHYTPEELAQLHRLISRLI